ncbi:hypothetical protein ACFOG5_00235 [Pedobacter fastidiosus]|uniref:Uncharacterized protein n=1 Tax=Pedobacter fastidiosus TaxID=2765361 RepID=A0ABR7KYR5_9SPHI|nr:hypothetical protein [Pedobacter fastidiosus]MBC6113176.1 hypothetical protein [Pedobacter fastidiosus]
MIIQINILTTISQISLAFGYFNAKYLNRVQMKYFDAFLPGSMSLKWDVHLPFSPVSGRPANIGFTMLND